MSRSRRDWIERTLGLLLLGGAVAVIGMAFAARVQFKNAAEVNTQTEQTRLTIKSIEGVRRGLVNAETGQRGYLLTGQLQYLDPYYKGIDTARSELSRAGVRLEQDPAQDTLDAELHALAEAKLQELQLTVALKHQHDDQAALTIVQGNNGQRLMTEIRSVTDSMIAREQVLLAQRIRASATAAALTETLFSCVQALLGLLFVGGYWLIRRELRSRASIKEKLQESESRLRSSERFLKGMADTLPVLIGYVDHNEIYRFANAHYDVHFGTDTGKIVGKTIAQVLGSVRYESVRDEVALALSGQHRTFERKTTVAGEERYVVVTYTPDIDSDGRGMGFFIMVTDITERKVVEVAATNQEKKLRTITDNVPALICYIDSEHKFRFNNQAYERWLQRPVSDITGRHLSEVYGEEIYQRLKPDLETALSGTRSNFDMSFRGRDGKPHQARGKYVPHRSDDGQVVGVYGLITDETKLKRVEQELRASQRFVERVGEVAGVGGWQMDLKTSSITWSNETCRMHDVDIGYCPTLDEAIRFYALEAQLEIANAVQRGIKEGTSWDLELSLISATGRPFWARAVGEIEYENGKPSRLIGAFQDITQRKAAEQALSDSREILQVTLESIGDAVITTDNESQIVWLNPVAERLTGWLKSEAIGKPLLQVMVILDEEARTPLEDPVRLSLLNGKLNGLAHRGLLVSRNGSEYGIEDSTSPILDAKGESHGAVLVFRDVSEQRRLNKEMSHRATHDPLTGLPNRSEFENRLGRLLSSLKNESSANALLYIDLDQFKLVNDACGHSVGDQLLRQVSSLLSNCIRGRDTVARLGGDEFGVILERCDSKNAYQVAQKICDQMEEFRFLHAGRRFRVGASIGLVPVDQRWTDMAAVLQAADASCYAAKEAGRNRVHAWFDTDFAVKARQGEMQWVSRLEQALDEDRFELYAQQIVNISGIDTGLHCEVLLRLCESDGSIVLPGVFLPAAERFNMATRIDRWVLRRVFDWLSEAETSGIAIEMVAINLSGHSVGDRAFHRDVRTMIGTANFDARHLCFEITETAAITNFSDAKAFIDDVRGLGVKISLDDFGAGASSFGYLKSLPVDFLKIDGQFIQDLLSDKLDHAAVRCFREVASLIGVKTIAECVETEDVREALADIGIDMIQGYLVHRPEPLKRFEVFAQSCSGSESNASI